MGGGAHDTKLAVSGQWLKLGDGHRVGSLCCFLDFSMCLEFPSKNLNNSVYMGKAGSIELVGRICTDCLWKDKRSW